MTLCQLMTLADHLNHANSTPQQAAPPGGGGGFGLMSMAAMTHG